MCVVTDRLWYIFLLAILLYLMKIKRLHVVPFFRSSPKSVVCICCLHCNILHNSELTIYCIKVCKMQNAKV